MSAAIAMESLAARRYKHSRSEWDAVTQTFRINMRVTPVQCFSITALQEFRTILMAIAEAPRGTVKNFVVASDTPGVFNFGGDLALFVLLARAKSIDGLKMYGRLCVDLVHWFEEAAERDIHTFALVKGDALGGGLEVLLPVHKVIFERSAEAGFPEVLFNLYPGMGAWNFVARRASVAVASELICSGAVRSAEELQRLGIVDIVAEDGAGEDCLAQTIAKVAPRHRGIMAALRIRGRMAPVTLESLQVIVDDWAESALGLQDRDLRLMERLARAQLKKVGGAAVGAIEEIKRMELEEALAAAAASTKPAANDAELAIAA